MNRFLQSLNILAACARQQQALAASVEAAVAAATAGPAVVLTNISHGYVAAIKMSARPFVSSTAAQQPHRQDEAPDKGDSYYWIPAAEEQSFTFDRRSIADRRAVGRLESALESVLLADGNLREQLVFQYGFSIHRVQPSKDRRTVFILWDASPGKAQACQRALEKTAFRLRRDLAKVLGGKFTPRLEFRHDHLPPVQASAAVAMEHVEQELAAVAAAQQRKRTGHGAAAAAGAAAAGDTAAAEQQLAAAAAAGARQDARDLTASAAAATSSSSSSSSIAGVGSPGAAAGPAATVSDDADMVDSVFAQDDVAAAIARLEVITRRRRPEV